MSQESFLSESDADDEDDYYDQIEPFDDSDLENDTKHTKFDEAIELFRQTYPCETFTARIEACFQEVFITLSVSLESLQDSVLDAWGLMKGLPLFISLVFDYPYFTKEKGKGKVYQKPSGANSSILTQLKNIIDAFCRSQLPEKNQVNHDPNIYDTVSSSERLGACKTSIIEHSALNDNVSSPSIPAKNFPSSTKGFFVKLYLYVQHRLLSLNEFCPICDECHDVKTATTMLKPVVCEKSLCIFSSQALGVMANAAESLHLQPEVVHLLLSTSMAAVFSSRHLVTMQPFIDVSVLAPNFEEFSSGQETDRVTVYRDALTAMPPIALLTPSSEKDLKKFLSLHHNLCYPLLRWIIDSNRSHIITLPKEKQLPFMGTDYQFLLRNSPPIEDENFRSLAKKHGSIFAFHGSPIDNWHSILRKGLIVASGTERQLNGAAYGKGIYLSPKFKTALRYSTHQKISQVAGSNYGSLYCCLTLCEVIKTPHLKEHGDIWVCPNDRYVCTRFIFGYKSGKTSALIRVADQLLDVTQQKYICLIKAALE